MASYSRTMNFLHQKLLQARTKEQEDRIVNLMFAESRRHQIERKIDNSANQTKSSSRQ
tara:strand:- start:952 stop:1125 length:174 start_codon:yes stop_codon:yes gene_type:complete